MQELVEGGRQGLGAETGQGLEAGASQEQEVRGAGGKVLEEEESVPEVAWRVAWRTVFL